MEINNSTEEKITMENYSELFYTNSDKITQGIIVPIISNFDIIDEKYIALLLIENACNLVKTKERKRKAKKVEYLLISDASTQIDKLNHFDKVIDLIQNRTFSTTYTYLPPITTEEDHPSHEFYKKYPHGFTVYCKESGALQTKEFEKNKLIKYICINTPYRDYIKNKFIQFKLNIPLFTISEDEAIAWTILRKIKDERKTLQDIKDLKPNKWTNKDYEKKLNTLVEKSLLDLEEEKYYKKPKLD